MNRASTTLLTVGLVVFVGLLVWQGVGAVGAVLAAAGWGLVIVALFHLLPLALDAAATSVLLERRSPGTTMRNVLLSRWAAESANSLLPAGQVGGPVLMARYLAHRGLPMRDAAAAVTVSTTMQALAQIVFAIVGVGWFAILSHGDGVGGLDGLGVPLALAAAVLGATVGAFWWAQRRGMFGHLLRLGARVFGRPDWSMRTDEANAIDDAVGELYRRHGRVVATFAWSLAGWLAGVGEVWLALHFLGHPVGWLDALLLESAGQAIRGAAFAIPGSLGAQEGGFLLLAPLVGLPLEVALALSLVKRSRELLLGLPGLVHLHRSERRSRLHAPSPLPAID